MTIRAALTHQASVSRTTTTTLDAMSASTYTTVATAVPVLLDHSHQPQDAAQATSAQTSEADRTGLVIWSKAACLSNVQAAGGPLRGLVFPRGWAGLSVRREARRWHLSGALEGRGVAGEGLRLSAESEQVELGAGPVAVVVVKGPVQAGPVRPLSTVGALQGCDQQERHDDEQESVHGS